MFTEGSSTSKHLPNSSKILCDYKNSNNELTILNNNNNNPNTPSNIINASARFCNSPGVNFSYLTSLKKETSNFADVKKEKNVSSVKSISLYIGNEWWKGILFLIIITIISFISILILQNQINTKIKLIEFIIIIIKFVIILVAIFSDPGIIPVNSPLKHTLQLQNLKLKEYPVKLHVLRGNLINIKVCRTCLITRPFGCSHCSVCNLCINKFDHHCPWIGNCVGIRNYKVFYYLLHILNIHLLFSLSCSIYSLIYDNKSKNNKLIFSTGIIITIVMFLAELFIFCLILSHTFYIIKGHTTYLRIKYKPILKITNGFYSNNFKSTISYFLYSKLCKRYPKITFPYIKPIPDLNYLTFMCPNQNQTIRNVCNYTYDLCSNSTAKKMNPNNIYINCFINHNENINQQQNSNNSVVLNNSRFPLNNLNNVTRNTFMRSTFAINPNLQSTGTFNDNKPCISCSINPRERIDNNNLNIVRHIKSESSESFSSSGKKDLSESNSKGKVKESSDDNIFFCVDNSEYRK